MLNLKHDCRTRIIHSNNFNFLRQAAIMVAIATQPELGILLVKCMDEVEVL